MYKTSSVTVRSWIKNGLLPNSKLEENIAGSVWLIYEDDLKDFQKPDRGRPAKAKEDETPKENPASGLEREN